MSRGNQHAPYETEFLLYVWKTPLNLLCLFWSILFNYHFSKINPVIIWPHIRTSDGEGNGTPLQNCLGNPMDGGAWWAAVHGVAKSRTQLSDFTFTFHFHALEKEMATHSSVLAWRIPGTGEPGGMPSMGSHRVGHDWSDLAAAAVATARKPYFPLHREHEILECFL